MADISKIKLANGTVVTIKDAQGRTDIAAAQASLSAEVSRATAAEASLSSAIAAEVSRATTAEGGLGDRITALESKGRYLSTWDATTGKPATYPELSQLVEGKYNYRSGDYYIVNKVAAENNLMPDGAYISYDSSTTTWTVPTKAFSGGTLSLGDQFQYDGSKWTYIASATTVAFGNIQGDADENANLKGKLDTLRNGKVDKTQTIAGVDLQDNITAAELSAGLGLKDLAFKASASGSTTLSTVDSITMKESTVAGNAAVTTTSTAATLTKGDYTPAGSVSGKTTAAGSIDVSLKDKATKDEASITYSSYTPAGTVAAISGGDFDALKTATFAEVSAATTGAVQIEGSNSKPDITVTTSTANVLKDIKTAAVLPTFSEGAFTAATWTGSSYTAPTWTGSSYSAPSLGEASKAAFANEGIVATVNASASAEDPDFEVLTFTSASTANAVTAQGSFSAGNVAFGTFGAGSLAFGTFDGGSKAADTFTQGAAAEFNTADVLNNATAALDAAPAFTGKYYINNTTTDKALKEVAFAGTSADIKASKVEYFKQEVSAATFTGAEASITASFTGSTAASILTTGVTYDKADASAAFSVNITPEVSAITSSAKDINITVS